MLLAHVVVTGSLFARKNDRARLDEEMALQVAQMIINDVTVTTRLHDPGSHNPSDDPDLSPGASFQL